MCMQYTYTKIVLSKICDGSRVRAVLLHVLRRLTRRCYTIDLYVQNDL